MQSVDKAMNHPHSLRPLARTARRLSLAGFFLACAPVLLVGCAPQVTVLSSRSAGGPEFHTVTVMGRGEVSAKPDIANAMLGVDVTAPTVADATSQAATRMNQVLAALKRAGIADADVRTANFSVSREQQPDYGGPQPMGYGGPQPMPMMAPMPDMPPPPPTPSAAPRGKPTAAPPMPPMPPQPMPMYPMQRVVEIYRVSNTVDVKIRDLGRVGAVLDAAIAAGANNILGVNFTLDKTEAIEVKAREKAAADARSRAEALAKLQGVTLAGVISIDETAAGGMPYPMPMMSMAMRGDMSGGTPTAPGEVTFTTQVQVVYALQGEGAAQATEKR